MLINLKLIFLPPYSPLNPMKKYWATLKENLKKITKNNRYEESELLSSISQSNQNSFLNK